MIRRGEIYWADLNPVKGKEQAGVRPVLIVSDDAINTRPLVVTVVIGTSALRATRKYSTNVLITNKESGLPKDTLFLCFQIRSLDQSRLIRKAGSAPTYRMDEIEEALRIVLRLPADRFLI